LDRVPGCGKSPQTQNATFAGTARFLLFPVAGPRYIQRRIGFKAEADSLGLAEGGELDIAVASAGGSGNATVSAAREADDRAETGWSSGGHGSNLVMIQTPRLGGSL